MQCNICQRPWSTRLPFSCACCARETLYQTRLNLAHTLLEHEAARSQIEQDLKECCLSVPKESVSTPSTRYNHHVSLLLDNVNAQRCASQERTQLVLDHARNLGIEAGNIRDEVASRRASTTERRKQLAAATERLARQEALNITPVLKSIGRTRDLWKALRTKTAESRLLLCREAASLYDLKKQAKAHARSKSNGYVIGGLPIYHLRELNGKNCF